jgi:hypothetical protein
MNLKHPLRRLQARHCFGYEQKRPGAKQAAEKGLFLAKLAEKVLPGLKPAFILLALCGG